MLRSFRVSSRLCRSIFSLILAMISILFLTIWYVPELSCGGPRNPIFFLFSIVEKISSLISSLFVSSNNVETSFLLVLASKMKFSSSSSHSCSTFEIHCISISSSLTFIPISYLISLWRNSNSSHISIFWAFCSIFLVFFSSDSTCFFSSYELDFFISGPIFCSYIWGYLDHELSSITNRIRLWSLLGNPCTCSNDW